MRKTFFVITVLAGVTAFSQNTVPDNGKVGLGTTTPQQQLHVKGNVQIDSNVYINKHVSIGGALEVGQKARFERLEVSGTLDAMAKSRFNDTVLAEKEVYLNGPVQSNLSFTGNGKNEFNGEAAFHSNVVLSSLGGLTDPTTSHFLFVNADNKVVKSSIPTFADGFATAIYSLPCLSDVNGNVLSPKWNNGTNKIYAMCANVGIGTTTPRAKLDVIGRGHVGQLAIGVDPTTMTGGFHMRTNGFSPSSSASVFRIENLSGRALFEINNQGFVQGREVIVEMDSIAWPDYVFQPDYKLPTLSEVETYIGKYGHLPNVPSAAKTGSEGLNLGEMNRILLEKVEELTLHLIAQEKRNLEQQKHNEQQDVLILELQHKLNNK